MVDTFDPGAERGTLQTDEVRALLSICCDPEGAERELSEGNLRKISVEDQGRFAPLVRHPGWIASMAAFTDSELSRLVRIFTLGEMLFNNWTAGDQSAVIPIVAERKLRDAYDRSLTRWIKAHSDNRFLPHGNITARL